MNVQDGIVMKIANPIYDVVFKYLMEDAKVARLLLSTIIGEKIISLESKPQERTVQVQSGEKSLTVYRLDYAAKIQTGDYVKTVLIEIQKAKYLSDLMRFRKYLGKQYMNKDNIYKHEKTGEIVPTPIIAIYLLGYPLEEGGSAPILEIKHQVYDHATKQAQNERDLFIQSLTHDAYIVQIPLLRQQFRTDAEALLSAFDQSNCNENQHILNIDAHNFPEKFQPLIRRLQAALSEDLEEQMDMEDEIIADLQRMDRQLAEKEAALIEKDAALVEKDAALVEKDAALVEKDQQIAALQARLTKLTER